MHPDNPIPLIEGLTEPAPEVLSDKELSAMKCEINNLIWMYSPKNITLGDADRLACDIQVAIMNGKV